MKIISVILFLALALSLVAGTFAITVSYYTDSACNNSVASPFNGVSNIAFCAHPRFHIQRPFILTRSVHKVQLYTHFTAAHRPQCLSQLQLHVFRLHQVTMRFRPKQTGGGEAVDVAMRFQQIAL
jgi:hypothetical protein